MVSLLVKAAAFQAPCSQALQGLQSKFGDMQVVGGDASRPAQPNPRLLLAAFNQQTAVVCHQGSNLGLAGPRQVWSATHACAPRLGQAPRRTRRIRLGIRQLV